MSVSNRCFLCGSTEEITEEHVFPQWLLNRANIRNKFVTLKNGTKYKYGSVKVPCCRQCNNEDLSNIENQISLWVNTLNFEKLRSNPNIVFIWLYKLMYGLNYKEMHIKEDIRNPQSPPLIDQKEFFDRISYNLFPLFAKGVVTFKGFKPYSLFIFKISDVDDGNYFYFDEPYKLVSGITIGKVGIVCSFQCDGYIEEDVNRVHLGSVPKTISLPNFGDFCAYIFALKARLKQLPTYTVHYRNGSYLFHRKEHGYTDLYNEFNHNLYVKMVTTYFKPLFSNLIRSDADGNATINYKSPFTQF